MFIFIDSKITIFIILFWTKKKFNLNTSFPRRFNDWLTKTFQNYQIKKKIFDEKDYRDLHKHSTNIQRIKLTATLSLRNRYRSEVQRLSVSRYDTTQQGARVECHQKVRQRANCRSRGDYRQTGKRTEPINRYYVGYFQVNINFVGFVFIES